VSKSSLNIFGLEIKNSAYELQLSLFVVIFFIFDVLPVLLPFGRDRRVECLTPPGGGLRCGDSICSSWGENCKVECTRDCCYWSRILLKAPSSMEPCADEVKPLMIVFTGNETRQFLQSQGPGAQGDHRGLHTHEQRWEVETHTDGPRWNNKLHESRVLFFIMKRLITIPGVC